VVLLLQLLPAAAGCLRGQEKQAADSKHQAAISRQQGAATSLA